jgi:transposase-like protein
MIASKPVRQRGSHRRWPLSEKRRIVELTLQQGASVSAIARAHGVNPTSLSHWRTLYAAGKLAARAQRATLNGGSSRSKPTLLPVRVESSDSVIEGALSRSLPSQRIGIVQLTFACGATLRIENDRLDLAMICALVAQVQR